MNKNRLILFLTLFIAAITFLVGREFRVNKIPNGSINSCSNCHFNPSGGGPRNPFGQAVETRVTPGGFEDFWDSSLAAMDSDGDGFSNGQELQDPNGLWRPGQPNPGDPSKVTNPGDPFSKPNISDVANNNIIPSKFLLSQNYPNPFNPTTTINFNLPVSSHVKLDVFDILGRYVTTLVNEEKAAGSYTVKFDANGLANGIYIYRIKANNYIDSKKMLLLK
ncbi:T9SS type A sorting domain-containing protein [Melioribacteraceae bacterium 4301-Me]|uniref:T9SS type A sorting domain-containing protein n=1 Tax=Pyranulibacter aquaticus TaxID=3163344 RepID=UPI003596B9B2